MSEQGCVKFKKSCRIELTIRNPSNQSQDMTPQTIHSTDSRAHQSRIKIALSTASLLLLTSLTDTAQAKEMMCKVADPNDTYVNLRYPANGELMRSLTNGSWIEIDSNGTTYDRQGRPWTASVSQRTRSPIGREYVLSQFVYGCRPGNSFSEWFIRLK